MRLILWRHFVSWAKLSSIIKNLVKTIFFLVSKMKLPEIAIQGIRRIYAEIRRGNLWIKQKNKQGLVKIFYVISKMQKSAKPLKNRLGNEAWIHEKHAKNRNAQKQDPEIQAMLKKKSLRTMMSFIISRKVKREELIKRLEKRNASGDKYFLTKFDELLKRRRTKSLEKDEKYDLLAQKKREGLEKNQDSWKCEEAMTIDIWTVVI